MVGLLSGSMYMDFPLCLPIREPVLTGFFNIFNIELSICQHIRGIRQRITQSGKLFQTLNTII